MQRLTQVVYVHVGAHKTATTSLQAALAKNDLALHAQGIGVLHRNPGVPVIGAPQFSYTRDLLRHLRTSASSLVEPAARKKARRRLAQLSALPPWLERVMVLSDEALLGSPFTQEGGFYPEAVRRIKTLRHVFPERELRLILYVRPQPEFLQSWYVQSVLQGSQQSFSEFIQGIDLDRLSWARLAKDLDRVVGRGNLVVRDFSSIRAGFFKYAFDFFSLFADATGFELVELKENRSVSAPGLHLMRLIARFCSQRLRRKLRTYLQPLLSAPWLPPAQLMNEELKDKLRKQYADDIRRAVKSRKSWGVRG